MSSVTKGVLSWLKTGSKSSKQWYFGNVLLWVSKHVLLQCVADSSNSSPRPLKVLVLSICLLQKRFKIGHSPIISFKMVFSQLYYPLWFLRRYDISNNACIARRALQKIWALYNRYNRFVSIYLLKKEVCELYGL